MKKLIVLIYLVFVMCHLAKAQSLPELDKVKEIKLLESNRDDVRKIFAGYKFENNNLTDYGEWIETTDAEIEFSYSEGKCQDEDSNGFNIDKWKVDRITFKFKNPAKAKHIGVNLTKYKKERMYIDEADVYAYFNKELGILFTVRKNKIEEIGFSPPSKYYNLMCDKEKAKILSSTPSIFDRELKYRQRIIGDAASYVKKLHLSRTKLTASCNSSDSSTSCSHSVKTISVFAVGIASDNDVLTYSYTVSGGKIIGKGAKVQWDLSGVKAGTYTITAAVDDGCGFCGKTITKTVTVKECPDCKEK